MCHAFYVIAWLMMHSFCILKALRKILFSYWKCISYKYLWKCIKYRLINKKIKPYFISESINRNTIEIIWIIHFVKNHIIKCRIVSWTIIHSQMNEIRFARKKLIGNNFLCVVFKKSFYPYYLYNSFPVSYYMTVEHHLNQ